MNFFALLLTYRDAGQTKKHLVYLLSDVGRRHSGRSRLEVARGGHARRRPNRDMRRRQFRSRRAGQKIHVCREDPHRDEGPLPGQRPGRERHGRAGGPTGRRIVQPPNINICQLFDCPNLKICLIVNCFCSIIMICFSCLHSSLRSNKHEPN